MAAPATALDLDRRVEDYTVQSWTIEDGLPHNMIHRIAQSEEGFLWLATWEGAVRFNGRDFSVFNTYNVPGMTTRGFRAVLPDPAGGMLLGSTRNGLWRVRGDDWQPVAEGELAKVWTTSLLRLPNGALWIGSEDGLYRLDARGKRTGHFDDDLGQQPAWVFKVLEQDDGSVLVAAEGGLFRIAADADRAEPFGALSGLPPGPARTLTRRRNGEVLVAGDRGVYRLQGQRLLPLPGLEHARVDALLEDRDGALWANTSEHGLMHWYQGRVQSLGAYKGITGRGTEALIEDREGLIWVGTTNGLFRIADGPVKSLDTARGLTDGYTRTVLAASDGSVWIGTGLGADVLRDGKLSPAPVRWASTTPSSVLTLAENRDGVWLGTFDEGLIRASRRPGDPELRARRSDGLPSDHIRAIEPASDGGLWIGTVAGLAHRSAEGVISSFRGEGRLPETIVRSLAEQPDGQLWIGTGTGLALRSPDGRFRVFTEQEYPATSAFDFLSDADGTLWIGSDRGLVRHRDGQFTAFGQDVGLPNESIFRVLADPRGDLWLTSNDGVFRIPRAQFAEIDAGTREELSVDVIDHADGMPSSQANGSSMPAGAMTGDGRLWVPTAAGVAIIDTAAVAQAEPDALPLAIERISIDGVRMSLVPLYERPVSEARRIVIRYAGLSFRNAGNLRYRYRLEGFDPDWVDVADANEAVFTNLPPGDFRFRVQATVRPSEWDRATVLGEQVVDFRLQPPFWRTPWFQALVAVLGLLALIGVWRLRTMIFERRAQALRDMVEARTQELSEKNAALQRADREREFLMVRLERQATQDELTGLPNRRAGDQRLAAICADEAAPLACVALLDLDRFKAINDQHGHAAGDAVLRAVARVIAEAVDEHGFASRHGGEEFMLAFCGLAQSEAWERCERLRRELAVLKVRLDDGQVIGSTASIGLSRARLGATPDELLREADEQLYRAKAAGRDRVYAAE
ncbi:two-component regulator propeller domain-containing protein [Arenimonas sp. MALMAid1274]|uniref:two-component regulator propeller domain-containing protein n=1 Tax=Arenimonas sp. MALMAid1274 TaxID=3411630 RepID=UPI003BA24C4F